MVHDELEKRARFFIHRSSFIIHHFLSLSLRSPTPTATRTFFYCYTLYRPERGFLWSISRRGPEELDDPSSALRGESAVGNKNRSQQPACASTIRNGAAPAHGSSPAGCQPC